MTAPTRNADICRNFTFTDLEKNNNKYWNVKYWLAEAVLELHFGRIGTAGTIQVKPMSRSKFEDEVAKRFRKGYKEITLHKVTIATATTGSYHKAIETAVRDLMKTAGQNIQTFLNTTVEAMSLTQVEMGRRILAKIDAAVQKRADFRILQGLVTEYLNAIPTKLPARITPSAVVNEFVSDLTVHADRLAQLEAAVAQVQVTPNGKTWGAFDALADQMEYLEPTTAEWLALAGDINKGMVHGYKVKIKAVFKVTIAAERAKYEASKKGKTNIVQLYHGTNAANLVHILRGGLKIMGSATNGRMFGHGLYYASEASKSTNYCSTSHGGDQYLIVSDVAVGKQWVAPQACNYLAEAPNGYDSVWGKKGATSGLINHEYIVYKEEQATIKYLVVYTR